MTNRLIFQHIPKTAGTSLATLIRKQFEEKHQFICGKDGVLNDFLELPQEKKDDIQLLIGHVDFGIHEQFSDASRYITFLREPVERVLSHYYFIKECSIHRYHQYALDMNIIQFIQSGLRPRMNNCMVRMLSGINPDYGKCFPEMVATAMKNIKEYYDFVGFISDLESSVQSLCSQFNYRYTALPLLNITKKKPSFYELSPEIIDEIRKYNSLDIELFHLVYKNYGRKKPR